MVGERGSGLNAFSMFLILILLYFAQRSDSANVYSQNVKTQDHPEQTEKPMEEKLAVGLSNGDVEEYISDYTNPEPVASVDKPEVEQTEFEQTFEQIMEDTFEPTFETTEEDVAPVVEMAEDEESLEEEEAYEEIESEVEPEEVPLAEELTQEPEEKFVSELFIEEMQTEVVGSNEVTEEQPEISSEAEFAESEQIQQAVPVEFSEVTEEPILGGQDKLFLKPVINDLKIKKTEHNGPKISIRFGS